MLYSKMDLHTKYFFCEDQQIIDFISLLLLNCATKFHLNFNGFKKVRHKKSKSLKQKSNRKADENQMKNDR